MKNRLLTLLLALFATHSVLAQNTELPLKAGDRVTIRIAGVPDGDIAQISGMYTVTDSGTISLAHISPVRATGKKPSQLGTMLAQTFVNEEIFTHPTVTVSIDSGDSATARMIYIVSGCNHNGNISYTAGMTVFKAISAAGGFNNFAKTSKAKLIRNGTTYMLDLSKHTPEVDIKLEPEDQIIVPD
ncbi:MAG: polysaccharide biosynthesis/export family protein [Verrucomicrobiaceae bacterium]|nr:polysaccharide biosynthesis/export family protein [Verrucomicrobiaceae bacterium]